MIRVQYHLDLPERYLTKVCAILHQYVPDYDVWAYGSRVTGGAYAASDLDLVVRNPRDLLQPCERISDLIEAFIESDLPIRVDVMDWARIPDSFRREIEHAYVVVQERSQISLKADTQP
ncbi:nucleotidyltransferase family protein [uncultured Chloroflexus sp.]|uniref:nucleotidyltransferase family protein n=1 Tax=uncultured Chloroflexus sp. TaxID=214040 RepID=UPI00260FA479|nr:nucleotidyltransferase domain-containing protein [uncultured Chloroflexus sp.]